MNAESKIFAALNDQHRLLQQLVAGAHAMTYSQLLLRVGAATIALCATYFLVTDRLCLLSKIDGCRPVHGLSAIALFLAAVALAASLLVAATQPRRGARVKNLLVAWTLFVVLYTTAFVLDLVKAG